MNKNLIIMMQVVSIILTIPILCINLNAQNNKIIDHDKNVFINKHLNNYPQDIKTDRMFENLDNIQHPDLLLMKAKNKQQGILGKLDSVIYYARNQKYKATCEYNTKGRIVEYENQFWDTSLTKWITINRYSYTYHNNGYLQTQLFVSWLLVSSQWIKFLRSNSTYDAAGNRLSDFSEFLDWDTNQWEYYRTTHNYDDFSIQLYSVKEKWDNAKELWLNLHRINYFYISSDTTNEISQTWDSTLQQWVTNRRYTISYDDNGYWLSRKSEKWESWSAQWINDYKTTLVYNVNGKIISQLSQKWENALWTNSRRELYSYDAKGYLQTGLWETWNAGTLQWGLGIRQTYTIDYSLNLIHSVCEKWDGTSWKPIDSFCFLDDRYLFNCRELYAYYSSVSSVNLPMSKIDNYSLEQNYPNPFNSQTLIKYDLRKPSFVSIKIYNTSGQEIKTLVAKVETSGSHSAKWDSKTNWGEPVTSGVYLIVMKSDNFSQVRKMTLMR